MVLHRNLPPRKLGELLDRGSTVGFTLQDAQFPQGGEPRSNHSPQETNMAMFGDSIDENMDLMRELLGNCTHGQKERAKRIAMQIETVVASIQKDNQKDGAAGLGLAFAVMFIAQNLVKEGSIREDGPRIQLLS